MDQHWNCLSYTCLFIIVHSHSNTGLIRLTQQREKYGLAIYTKLWYSTEASLHLRLLYFLVRTLKRTHTHNASRVTLTNLCFAHEGSYSSSIVRESEFEFYSLPKNISSRLVCVHAHFNTINYVHDNNTKPYYRLSPGQSILIDSISNTIFVIDKITTSKCACTCTCLSVFNTQCKQMWDKCHFVQSANYSTNSISRGQ